MNAMKTDHDGLRCRYNEPGLSIQNVLLQATPMDQQKDWVAEKSLISMAAVREARCLDRIAELEDENAKLKQKLAGVTDMKFRFLGAGEPRRGGG